MNLYFFTGQFYPNGFCLPSARKARNKTRREGKVDKVLCPQIIISREQTVNKFTQRREPFVASSSEQLQGIFSTFGRESVSKVCFEQKSNNESINMALGRIYGTLLCSHPFVLWQHCQKSTKTFPSRPTSDIALALISNSFT